jgi:hypothetical protein
MKKLYISVALLTICACTFAQTFVSTTPSNKNALLEEFTGVICGYCPDGHRIAQELEAANPGRFFAINIHQGIYANTKPDFRTQWGDQIAAQTGLTGYPQGTISRHVFTGANTILSRSGWSSAMSVILGQASPVNVAAQSSVDWSTRILTVKVEAYYTRNAANPTNKLNVALLQNNILERQVGTSLNPKMIVGSLYKHVHMLRQLLTDQWGVDISSTTAGSFFSQTFTYQIPAHINNIPIILDDLEIIVFVTEGHQEILNAAKSTISDINKPAILARLNNAGYIDIPSCDGTANAFVTLKNGGSSEINQVKLTYKIQSGADQTYVWNKRKIAAGTFDTLRLPNFTVTPNVDQVLNVNITSLNGSDFSGATVSTTIFKNFKKTKIWDIKSPGNGTISLKLLTDRYASETTFKIHRPDGTIILEGGPWTDLSASGTTERNFIFKPNVPGCYLFELYDKYGDGINSGNGAGGLQFTQTDENGNEVLLVHNGRFNDLLNVMFFIDFASPVKEISAKPASEIMVYPNPAENKINIKSEILFHIELMDVKGNVIISREMEDKLVTLNLDYLSGGIYTLRFSNKDGFIIKKIIKK